MKKISLSNCEQLQCLEQGVDRVASSSSQAYKDILEVQRKPSVPNTQLENIPHHNATKNKIEQATAPFLSLPNIHIHQNDGNSITESSCRNRNSERDRDTGLIESIEYLFVELIISTIVTTLV